MGTREFVLALLVLLVIIYLVKRYFDKKKLKKPVVSEPLKPEPQSKPTISKPLQPESPSSQGNTEVANLRKTLLAMLFGNVKSLENQLNGMKRRYPFESEKEHYQRIIDDIRRGR